jgi:hypothetical protein
LRRHLADERVLGRVELLPPRGEGREERGSVRIARQQAGARGLNWTPPPAGTVELALIVQDPDVPIGKPATHALTLGIDPARDGIPENALTNPSPIPGIRHGKGALGRRGYAGPMPVRSHGPHAYVFQLFALDQALALPDGFTLDNVIAAIKGHVIGRSRLDGTYEIR